MEQLTKNLAVATSQAAVQNQNEPQFFFSSRRRHTRYWRDWSSDVCSSDLRKNGRRFPVLPANHQRIVCAMAAVGSSSSTETKRPARGRPLRHLVECS